MPLTKSEMRLNAGGDLEQYYWRPSQHHQYYEALQLQGKNIIHLIDLYVYMHFPYYSCTKHINLSTGRP